MHIPGLSIKTMLRQHKFSPDSVRHTVSHGIDRYEIVMSEILVKDICDVDSNITSLIEEYVTATGNPNPLVIIRFCLPTEKPIDVGER